MKITLFLTIFDHNKQKKSLSQFESDFLRKECAERSKTALVSTVAVKFPCTSACQFSERYLVKNASMSSKGITLTLSYKSVCTALGIIISFLLSPFNLAKASLLK